MTSVLHLDDVSLHRGSHQILSHVSWTVEEGQHWVLLGSNGAGKTTLVNQVVGLLCPTSGSIRLDGVDAVANPALARRLTNVQAQANVPITGLTPLTAIDLVGRIRGGRPRQTRRRAEELIDALDLGEWARTPAQKISGGVARLTAFAMCAVVPGRLVILDEPTNGLDPAGIEEVRRLLVELAGEGVTVMVSSHLLDEIDRMASTLGILSAGRLVFQGTRAELMERSVPDILIDTPTPQAVLDPQVLAGLVPAQALTPAASTAAGNPGAPGSPNPTAGAVTGPTLTPQGARIPGMSKEAVAELISRLVTAGVELHEVRRETQSLEDVFMDLTGRGGVL